jgi:hypothetical protein
VQENTVLGRMREASIAVFATIRGNSFRGVNIAKGITCRYINSNVNRITRKVEESRGKYQREMWSGSSLNSPFP